MDKKDIIKSIPARLQHCGCSIADLARRSGTQHSAISKWVHGCPPKYDSTLRPVMDALVDIEVEHRTRYGEQSIHDVIDGFGDRLAAIGHKKSELCQKAGVNYITLYMWQAGRQRPSWRLVREMDNALKAMELEHQKQSQRWAGEL